MRIEDQIEVHKGTLNEQRGIQRLLKVVDPVLHTFPLFRTMRNTSLPHMDHDMGVLSYAVQI